MKKSYVHPYTFQKNLGRVLKFTPFLFALISTLFFYIFFILYRFPDILLLTMFALSVFLMLYIAFFAIFSRNNSILLLIFSFYHVFIFIVPGMFHITAGRFPFYGMNYPMDNIFRAATIVLFFSIASFLGFFSFSAKRNIVKIVKSSEYSDIKIIISIFIILAASLLSAYIIGFGELMMKRSGENSRTIDVSLVQNQILITVSRFGSYITAMMSWILLRKNPKIITLFIASITTTFFIIINLPQAIPRFYLLGYALGILYIFTDTSKPMRKLSIFLVMIGALNFIFPYLNKISRDYQSSSPIEYYTEHGDFDSMQSTLNVIKWVDQDGYQYGVQFLGSILAFVPRSIWLDKPESTGMAAGQAAGYKYLNLSSPLLSEYYVDFSLIGVLILGYLTGYIASWIDQRAVEILRSGDLVMPLLFAVLIGFEAIILRGSLMAAITPVGVLVFIVIFMQKFSKIRKYPINIILNN